MAHSSQFESSASSEDLVHRAARAYAHQLVTFVEQAHGMLCITEAPEMTEVFNPNAGRVVVACAKTRKCKLALGRSMKSVMKNYGQYQMEFLEFCNNFIRPLQLQVPLQYFMISAFVIEISVFATMRGVRNAGEIAICMITQLLLSIDDGKFVANGGLNILNDGATYLLATDSELKEAYSGLFTGYNFANVNETV